MTQKEREEEMLACERCVTLPFRAAVDGDVDPQLLGYRIMGEHAAYVKPCSAHGVFAKPVRLSREHGVTDPHDLHAFDLSAQEAKPA